jgi:hypothetical protein
VTAIDTYRVVVLGVVLGVARGEDGEHARDL